MDRNYSQGPIVSTIFWLAIPLAFGLLVQALYSLVDIFFLAKLGSAVAAGASATLNIAVLTTVGTQVVDVGTMALVGRLIGGGDRLAAQSAVRHSLVFSSLVGLAYGAIVHPVGNLYVSHLLHDAEALASAQTYLQYLLPGLCLQFMQSSLAGALRARGAMGVVATTQILSVVLNGVLAPALITGWLGGHSMGAGGAGLATSISVAFSVVVLFTQTWRSRMRGHSSQNFSKSAFAILRIGTPSAVEVALFFVIASVMYWAAREIGPTAQAGIGIGGRITQMFFLPAIALASAAGPVIAQSAGAGLAERARRTLWVSLAMCSLATMLSIGVCQVFSGDIMRFFTADESVVTQGALYIKFISLNLFFGGINIVCAAALQAFDRSTFCLAASLSRIVTFIVPAATIPWNHFSTLKPLWILSIASIAIQAVVNLYVVSRSNAFGRSQDRCIPAVPLPSPHG